ncbi:hypothetical protein BP6252_02761 [Coleophoma cylindrospora]|uniref:Carbohydrate kinase PfkB domain-containing protein n=1 Tax=Coleophoma cylindrospora TaxID=1849047 RepID=A0A3D8SG48_9HELO|nr:hypothetical protein BP6252_02761 [Coleophoma cylindrospora]
MIRQACRSKLRPSCAFSSQGRQFSNSRHGGLSEILKISPEVQHALKTFKPVVALETTIYTHGFPHPDNTALALQLESVVRANGGVPATIGILDGKAHVGLTSDEILRITEAAGDKATMKISRRDLPYILGMGLAGTKLTGGTTVAGTMLIAQEAGIKVFGTGGLGGVHRGAQDSMDISADLTELGRTPVAVVSSGCKSFLDIPRTLEYLETQGVGVFTFADGRTGDIDFPAFWSRDSGIRSPMVVQTEREAAAMIYSQRFFNSPSGLLFANPIPAEHSIPKADMDLAIEQAVAEAAEQGFHGHRNTPFILARIKELTKGNSIPANRALIVSNVTRATKIAMEYQKLEADWNLSKKAAKQISVMPAAPPKAEKDEQSVGPLPKVPSLTQSHADVIVVGSVAVDLSCDYNTTREPASGSATQFTPQMHTSNRATISQSIGGVGFNVALATSLASGGKLAVSLKSMVADDFAGNALLSSIQDAKRISNRDIKKLQSRDEHGKLLNSTAQYVAVNDAKMDLVLAMADMSIFTRNGFNAFECLEMKKNTSARCVVVDGNWNPTTIRDLTSNAKASGANVIFEPVSNVKATGLFEPVDKIPLPVFSKHNVDLATPNHHELASMHKAAAEHELFESAEWWKVIDSLGIPSTGARDRFVALTGQKLTDEGVPLQSIQLLPFIPTILTKLGADGVLMTELLRPNDPKLTDPASAPYILSRCTNESNEVGGVYMRLFPAVETVKDVISVNGVGDTFLGVLVAGLAKGLKLEEKLIGIAQKGAVMTLQSTESVHPKLWLLERDLNILYEAAGLKALS